MDEFQRKPKQSSREYLELVMQESGYSTYLSNSGTDLKTHPVIAGRKHIADWVGVLVPEGHLLEQCRDWIPMHSWIIERLIQWSVAERQSEVADGFMSDLIGRVAGKVPDSTTLQRAYEGDVHGAMGPNDIILNAKELADRWFPAIQFLEKTSPDAPFPKAGPNATFRLPIRIVASLVYLGMACEEANRGDTWYLRHHNVTYQRGRLEGKPKAPRVGGCYMAYVVYLLRRHTEAGPKQIAAMLKIPTWE